MLRCLQNRNVFYEVKRNKSMAEETKICPFCGEDINLDAIKCEHCGEILQNIQLQQVKKSDNCEEYVGLINTVLELQKSNILKNFAITILAIAMIVFIVWIFAADYPAINRNHENFWYGQYLISAILHTLLAILCALIIIILKKQ